MCRSAQSDCPAHASKCEAPYTSSKGRHSREFNSSLADQATNSRPMIQQKADTFARFVRLLWASVRANVNMCDLNSNLDTLGCHHIYVGKKHTYFTLVSHLWLTSTLFTPSFAANECTSSSGIKRPKRTEAFPDLPQVTPMFRFVRKQVPPSSFGQELFRSSDGKGCKFHLSSPGCQLFRQRFSGGSDEV